MQISATLAQEFQLKSQYIENTLALFSEGATVPFIARYRKEATGGMSDETLRELHSRWNYLQDLEKRKESILTSLQETNADKSVYEAVKKASTKTELEDIYAPFKKTRKSKGDIAIEQGLLPFAQQAWEQDITINTKYLTQVQQQIKSDLPVTDIETGIESIILERLSENAALLQAGREYVAQHGLLVSRVMRGKKEQGEKFQDYFEHQEPVRKAASHRILAMLRGKRENILKLAIQLEHDEFPRQLQQTNLVTPFGTPCKQISSQKRQWLNRAWGEKLLGKLETDVLAQLKDKAENEAIQVFADNLQDLLMAAPAGAHNTLGLDPGFRNGVKMAAINAQGDVIDHGVIYPHSPQNQSQQASALLRKLIEQHRISWVVIGNGTASRETQTFANEVIKQYGLNCRTVIVSEAGASVYSASKEATQELPDLDVTIRGAVSIARRFQDPLAELVKIDPQAIGVGQYQHDLKGSHLSEALTQVVETCVNRVGVDLNLASPSLLSYVSGLSLKMAQNILEYRQQIGRFTNREQIKKVKGIGAKAFEQCAGFLRIRDGEEPLDASAVHPESYGVVKAMAQQIKLPLSSLIGNTSAINQLKLAPQAKLAGEYTLRDILEELAKPGRDPRPEFRYAAFDDSISDINDLREDMVLEGVVTNVAAFGAFVDIGVHQDGLVHISQLADRFVKDPREEVRVGEVIKVKVLECDVKRKRISLKRI